MNNVVAYERTVYPASITVQPVPDGVTGSGGSGGSSPGSAGYALHRAYQGAWKFPAFTASGQRVFHEGITRGNGSSTTTAVIYRNHTWWTATGSGGPAGNRPAPSSCMHGGESRSIAALATAGLHPVPAGLRSVHGGGPGRWSTG